MSHLKVPARRAQHSTAEPPVQPRALLDICRTIGSWLATMERSSRQRLRVWKRRLAQHRCRLQIQPLQAHASKDLLSEADKPAKRHAISDTSQPFRN